MDEWNDDSNFSGGNSPEPWEKQAAPKGIRTGGWHWVMTLVCIATVTALSFLMAWLTKDIVNRPSWMIGAIFTVPTLGMFAAALLVEKKTSAMTPVSSRRVQYLVVLIAIVATFTVGCVCDLLYQHSTIGQVIRNWAETHPPETVYSDIVLMVDKSSSLEENGMDTLNRKAIKEWVDGMDDKARVGVVVFSYDALRTVPVDTLAFNREKIRQAMDVDTVGYTDFDVALYHAFRLVDAAESGRAKGRTT
ncbi:MAG: VWA domain-containing protein, partial [Clostridia bacterium]|nr:VWA domain-containing protein [Clostridia bacterium]